MQTERACCVEHVSQIILWHLEARFEKQNLLFSVALQIVTILLTRRQICEGVPGKFYL